MKCSTLLFSVVPEYRNFAIGVSFVPLTTEIAAISLGDNDEVGACLKHNSLNSADYNSR